jgi:MOSC domain-containing protein YiiM
VKLVSVNIGLPRRVKFENEFVTTGIFKNPVDKRINLKKLNLEGDKQADLTVHGGPDKAVYSYPSEYYGFWKEKFPDIPFNWGIFGENLTTLGLFESQVNIGDMFQIGTAKVVATQPRMPCYKLGVKFGRMDIIKKFLESGKSGIYFKVVKEGEIGTDDSINLVKKDNNDVTIENIVELVTRDKNNKLLMEKVVKVQDLPPGWKHYFLEKLSHLNK